MSVNRVEWAVRVIHKETGNSVTLDSLTSPQQRSPSRAIKTATHLLVSRLHAPDLTLHDYTYELDREYPNDIMPLRRSSNGGDRR